MHCLIRHLDQFRRSSNGSPWDDAALLGDSRSLHDDYVELVVGPVLGIVTLPNTISDLPLLNNRFQELLHKQGLQATYLNACRCSLSVEVEKGCFLGCTQKIDPALVDTLGDLLANLMRTPPFDHIQPCPSILCLCTRRSTNKEGVLELPL